MLEEQGFIYFFRNICYNNTIICVYKKGSVKMQKNKKDKLKELCVAMIDGLGFNKINSALEIISKGRNFLSCNDTNTFSKAVWDEFSKLESDSSFSEDDIEYVTYKINMLFVNGNENVVNYYGNKTKLINKLTEGSPNYRKCSTERFSEYVVNILFNNLAEFTPINDLVKKYGDIILESIAQGNAELEQNIIQNTNDKIEDLKLNISKISKHESKSQDDTNVIQNENWNYLNAYTKPLFLEGNNRLSTSDNSVYVSLEHIYIKPSNENKTDLERRLKKWQRFGEPLINKSTVFLLYGNAGVGKSSLVSWVIANNFFDKKCHAIALRNHIDDFDNIYNNKKSQRAWSAVKKCFNCDTDIAYKDTILILDGLDEMCVLKPDFSAESFLGELENFTYPGVKILITTRSGYFKESEVSGSIITDTLKWNEKQITTWCSKYKNMHSNNQKIEKWCSDFPKKFKALPDNDENDKRKEIFCVPIILYICCVSNIDIGKHTTIVSIYDEAFKKIAHHEHNKDSIFERTDNFNFEIQWTYTKELAYQMFLSGELGLSNEYVNVAQQRTKEIRNCAEYEIKSAAERYFAVFPFASKNCKSQGVEFAHKTVSDYFSAVKLFEDYFDEIKNEITDEKIWENIYQAFRYKSITPDIIKYLGDLIKKTDNYIEWRNKFFNAYYRGMENEYLWKIMHYNNINCYICQNLLLPEQVAVAFRNLTWLLTELEFYKFDIFYSDKVISVFSSYILSNGKDCDIKCNNWKLNDFKLVGACLTTATLSGTYLINTHLYSANLSLANLSNSHLMGSDLSEADLSGADLSNADLSNAVLSGANLSNTNLYKAILNKANLENIIISRNDLPQFNEALQKKIMKKFTPLIKDLGIDEIYDPKSNSVKKFSEIKFVE